MRAIAITSKTRSPLLPEVPTTAEQGFGEIVGSAWNGIVAPAGTPKVIVDKLNNKILRILSAPDTKERFASLGMKAIGGTPQDFAKYLQAEFEKWAKIVEAAHLQMPQ